MSVDQTIFEQFREGVKHLGKMAQPSEMPDQERVQGAKQVFMEKLDARMMTDLEGCIHCGMCAEVCHFYVSTQDAKYTPIHKLALLRRFYRRELSPFHWFYKPFTKDITVQDLERWQELVYDSCTECGRCNMVCPMGINISAMVNVMRQALARGGLVPDELRAVAQEQCAKGSIFGIGPEQLKQAVQRLRETGLEVPLNKDKADVLVLTSVIDIMLFTEALAATAKIMNHLGLDWTLSACGYEAANFGLLSGQEETQRAASWRIIDEAIRLGAKAVILPECGHAYPALRWEGANQYGEALPFEVFVISEFMGREVKAGRLKLKKADTGKKVTFHDPCKVARLGGSIQEPRDVLNALGLDLREMQCHGVTNWCCGGGGGVFVINRAARLRQKAFEIKMEQVDDTAADSVVVTCGSCRLNFMNGAANAHWETPIESLVELVGANLAN